MAGDVRQRRRRVEMGVPVIHATFPGLIGSEPIDGAFVSIEVPPAIWSATSAGFGVGLGVGLAEAGFGLLPASSSSPLATRTTRSQDDLPLRRLSTGFCTSRILVPASTLRPMR